MHIGKYRSMFPMTNMLYSLECGLVHPQNFLGCSYNKPKQKKKDKFDKIEYF